MPMKIDGFSPQGTAAIMRHSEGRHINDIETEFSMELYDEQEGMSMAEMEKLLKKIDEQAARLSKTPTYDELKEYRTLIKNFVGEAVSRMYELHTQAGWDRMGRQKVYTTVRKIDKKLEEMAEKIRLGQSEQLDVIASHDAIRGMLVDLYM